MISNMDYKVLLKKYMKYLKHEQGTSFIEPNIHVYKTIAENVYKIFSKEEYKELQNIDLEIKKEK